MRRCSSRHLLLLLLVLVRQPQLGEREVQVRLRELDVHHRAEAVQRLERRPDPLLHLRDVAPRHARDGGLGPRR